MDDDNKGVILNVNSLCSLNHNVRPQHSAQLSMFQEWAEGFLADLRLFWVCQAASGVTGAI